MNVVIGGASGMGAAVARQLAGRGPLLIVDRNIDGAEKLAAELGSAVRAAECDITDQGQVEALFAGIEELDALVHTAGVSGTMATGRRCPRDQPTWHGPCAQRSRTTPSTWFGGGVLRLPIGVHGA